MPTENNNLSWQYTTELQYALPNNSYQQQSPPESERHQGPNQPSKLSGWETTPEKLAKSKRRERWLNPFFDWTGWF